MANADSEIVANLKVIVIGDSGVGKSWFVDDVFVDSMPATIGVDFKAKTITVQGNTVKLLIWDTAGMDRFRTLNPSYYRNAKGIVLVYDITSMESFRNLSSWLEEARLHCENPDVVKILIGNKVDEKDRRQVREADGIRFAHDHSMLFLETSAKSSHNVHMAFEELTCKILENPKIWDSHNRRLRLHENEQPTGVYFCAQC